MILTYRSALTACSTRQLIPRLGEDERIVSKKGSSLRWRTEYEESLRIAASDGGRTRGIGHRIVGTSHLVATEKLIAIRPGENHLVLFGIARESDDRAIQWHNFS